MLTECSFNDLSDMANSFNISVGESEAIAALPLYVGSSCEVSYSFNTAIEAIAEAELFGKSSVGFTYAIDEYNDCYSVTINY